MATRPAPDRRDGDSPRDLFAPGSLVTARGRDWIVLPGSTADVLRLRPLSGLEEDAAVLHTRLEPDVRQAQFPPPSVEPAAGQEAALLLRDALLLSLRRGAGPFRSFGQIAFEPRAYQLVPLLMALQQDPVRLLIADDVGIGKTIEAGLIARELYDRGEISGFAVLCPPHLVEQWVRELDLRFHLKATAVTASSAARLERGLPMGQSIFAVHPFTVVSLDYIKSEHRRDEFARACPEFVIVDEAHTCTNPGGGRQLRYDLLRRLVANRDRHAVLLTATPHSGDEGAFYRLLGLLDPEFEKLGETEGTSHKRLRDALVNHFVQRRRPDIDEWMDARIFPQRETSELTYRLTGAWEQFFEDVLDYCAAVTAEGGEDTQQQRLNFWGTLALMRCVSSSPAAAAKALKTMLGHEGAVDEGFVERVFDGSAEDLPEDDVEPGANTGDKKLQALVRSAEKLAGAGGDPKLALVLQHVDELIREGFAPVVFCRYIATAHYVAEHLRGKLKGVTVAAVTGEFPSDERIRQIEALMEAERRVLVATDCLSEGINLQAGFDAVVHYDLSWNPTRHEQREGRVDRYGQTKPVVRATLIYGANNAVDGAVLQVILRKAESIRRELGVPVPVPDEEHTLTQALMKAVLLRRRDTAQRELFEPSALPEARELEVRWTSLAEKVKRNTTKFAQRRLKPDEVLPEWKRVQELLGAQRDVERFVSRAMARLQAGLDPLPRGARAPLGALPETVQERLAADGLDGTIRIDFADPPAPGARFVHRSHPLVAALADDLLERALEEAEHEDPILGRLGRAGAWSTSAVSKKTLVLLLRIRHQITVTHRSNRRVLLAEEALPVAFVGAQGTARMSGPEVLRWLEAPARDIPAPARIRMVTEALATFGQWEPTLREIARDQATALQADHERVREAAKARGTYKVEALTPVDLMAAFVLVPPMPGA